MLASLVLALVCAPTYRQQYPLPSSLFGQGWGVNIHFTDEGPGEVAQIRHGGFHWIRMDFVWNATEREKGKYDFSAYDRLMKSLDVHKIRPIFILDYGNDLYQKGSPRNDESREAFCRWVAQAVRHFKGRGIVWEMWNEPNIFFWQPKPNLSEYVTLARKVGETIRREAAEEWYVGCATSAMDWAFLEGCFQAGLLRYWDAVTVHPYRSVDPETVLTDWARLRSLIATYAPKGKVLPMISGEWGYSAAWSGMTPEKQAQRMVRQYLCNLMAGVNLSIYYDWRDDGIDPKEAEHHFGTVDHERNPKPAYLAARNLSNQLDGYRYRMRLWTGRPDEYNLVFTKGQQVRMVGWNPQQPSPAVLPAKFSSRALTVLSKWKGLPVVLNLSTKAEIEAFVKSVKLLGNLSGVEQLRKQSEQYGIWTVPVDVTHKLSPKEIATQRVLVANAKPMSIQLGVGESGLSVNLLNPMGREFKGVLRVRSMATKRALTKLVQFTLVDRLVSVPFNDFTPEETKGSFIATLEQGSLIRLSTEPMRRLAYDQLGRGTASLQQDGDGKLHAETSLAFEPTEKGMAAEVTYKFPDGWKFLMLKPEGEWQKPIVGKPKTWGMWVYGDGSGNQLRMRFNDASGQTFQPDGPTIDWKGWKWVQFTLDGASGGHWGGIADGVVRYPIRFDALVLVDSVASAQRSGRLRFAGFALSSALQ